MKKKKMEDTQSIRITKELYKRVKQRAESNGRPIISEACRLLKDALDSDVELIASKQLQALKKYAGIIESLGPGNHARSIDETLYGGEHP